MKRIFWVLLSTGLLFPTLVWAMALGDLKLESALDQPFKAIIPIEEPGAVQENEITATLAPTQINDAITHDQQTILSDLRFQVVNENNGYLHIEIRSQQPVNEPFLQLPVMLSWPTGELLREYTVMLDPALAANAVNAASTEAPAANNITPAPHTVTTVHTPASVQPASGKKIQEPLAKKTTYGPTRQQDRLWQIASHYQQRGSHTSIQQWAFAIYSVNQTAFIDGNINKLKSQVYLQIPSLQVVMTHSKEETKKWLNNQERIPAGG
ncbi:MAG: hypothetical protein K0R12_655 [Gammaproteobacteria bacterium]|jgi:pilus assembly protein FimV|nr:hypothetical protein [Gammaproteobacteria bacterium]